MQITQLVMKPRRRNDMVTDSSRPLCLIRPFLTVVSHLFATQQTYTRSGTSATLTILLDGSDSPV